MAGQPSVRKLILETNGRLNETWVRATLALPETITLMEVEGKPAELELPIASVSSPGP